MHRVIFEQKQKVDCNSAKRLKRQTRPAALVAVGKYQAGHNDICDRQGQQKLPAKAHQLVITKTGQGPAHPYIEKKKKKTFSANQKSGRTV